MTLGYRRLILSTTVLLWNGTVQGFVPSSSIRVSRGPVASSAQTSDSSLGESSNGGAKGKSEKATPKRQRTRNSARTGNPKSKPATSGAKKSQERRQSESVKATPTVANDSEASSSKGPIEALRPLRSEGGTVWAEVNPSETALLYDKALHFCFSRSEDRWQEGLQIIREMENAGIAPQVDKYTRAVRACTANGKWQTALRIFDSAVSRQLPVGHLGDDAHGLEGSDENSGGNSYGWQMRGLWAAAVEACGEGGQWEQAKELLVRMNEVVEEDRASSSVRSSSSSGSRSLDKLGDPRSSLGSRLGSSSLSSEQQPGPQFEGRAFAHAIKACERAGQWRRAIELLNMGRANGVLEYFGSTAGFSSSSSSSSIRRNSNGYGSISDVSEGDDDSLPPILPFNMVLATLGRSGQWREALALLDELEAAADARARAQERQNAAASSSSSSGMPAFQRPGVQTPPPRLPAPDLVSYNSCVAACGRSGEWAAALRVLSRLKPRGIQPDKVTYASAISACAKAKPVRAEKALELLASMRADGVPADVVVYTALIDACAKAKGKLRAVAPSQVAATARALGSGSSSSSSNGRSSSFTTSAARTGPERALELLDEMRLDGLQPNGYTYGCAINACAAEGKWERALDLLEAARTYSQLQSSTSGGTTNSGSGSGSGGIVDQSTSNARTRNGGSAGSGGGGRRGVGRDGGVGLPAYNAALRACERGRQPQRALDLIGRMEVEAAAGLGPAPDVRSYTAAIAACAKAQPGTMANIALAPVLATAPVAGTKAGTASSKPAGATAATAVQEATCSGSSADAGAAPLQKSTVAWWEAALQLLRTAKRSGPASRPNCYAYASTCAACARDGQWKPALTLLDEMALLGFAPDRVAYNAALHACANANAWDACLTTHRHMVMAGLQPDDVSVSIVLGALHHARDNAPDAAAAAAHTAAAAHAAAGGEGGATAVGVEAGTSVPAPALKVVKKTPAPAPSGLVGAAMVAAASGQARTKRDWDLLADGVFEASLGQRPTPAFFAPPCLDTSLEMDLTSMPLPVAKAAVRWALRRILAERGILARALPRPNDDDDCEDSGTCEYYFEDGEEGSDGSSSSSGGGGGGGGGANRGAEAVAASWQIGGDYRGSGRSSGATSAGVGVSGRDGAVPSQWADGLGRLGGRPSPFDTGDLTVITGVGVTHTRAAAAARAKVKHAADALRSSAQMQQRARAAQLLSTKGAKTASKGSEAYSASSSTFVDSGNEENTRVSDNVGDGSSSGRSSSSGGVGGSLRDFVSTLLREELGLGAAVVPKDAPGTVVVPQRALDAWVAAQRETPTLE